MGKLSKTLTILGGSILVGVAYSLWKDKKDLEKMSKEAIEQIKNKKYDTQLKERGIKEITLLGLAFCGKRMKVSFE